MTKPTTTPVVSGSGSSVPVPSDSVVSETSFGASPAAGAAPTWSRSDHAHGTPTNPVTGHESTYAHANLPSAGEKEALAGTSGTPSSVNKYVTDGDSRLTNNRAPTQHAIDSATAHSSTATTGYMLKADASGLPSQASNTDTQVSDAVSKAHSNSLDHARSHALDATADHSIGSLTNTYLVKSDGSKLVPATNTDAQVSGAVAASHSNSLDHSRSHALDGTADHSIGGLTSSYLVKSDGSKLAPASNTDTQVSDAVSKAHSNSKDHTQNTDTGTTATSFVINSGGVKTTLSGSATTSDKVLTLPNVTDTLAVIGDIVAAGGMTHAQVMSRCFLRP